MNVVKVTLPNQATSVVASGTRVGEVLPSVCENGRHTIAAVVNNMVVPLLMPLLVDSTVEPLTISDSLGWSVYRNSVCFLLAKVCHDLYPTAACRVRYSFSAGFFCTLTFPDGREVVDAEVTEIRTAMRNAVAQDLSITMETVSYEQAVKLFKEGNQPDKLNLLAHRNPPVVLLSRCGNFAEISQQPLVPRLGLLPLFDLETLEGGFALRLPSSQNPESLAPLNRNVKRFEVYKEHIEWGRTIGITTVGDLNQAIVEHRAEDFVRTVEALHEKRLARIADEICRRGGVKLVLVAGPSSAGKTTSATRLVTYLRVNGLRPLLISTDNYFVGDARNPRDADGNLDYEHLDAVDRPRLNDDMLRLMKGESVRMRAFDFTTHDGYDLPYETRLESNGIIVMEGIHSLNPDLTPQIPREQKFLIYVNTFTQLGVDSSNRISTTDNRKIRRMVRDYQYRKRSPVETLRMWPSVARGEHRWIYPFQDNADAIFNSALDYELAVLKPMASLLLNQIKPWDREYIEARRLSGILHNFSTLAPDVVPGDSILRETIGGSQLSYT
ncbi:MAG: nucleoside kinase [Kiritimatiellae bacterium]|nr:nucleoside kinase [Kiritimatiellia bacterium]